MIRVPPTVALVALAAWGVALGAWVATAAAVVLIALVWRGRGRSGLGLAAAALALMLVAGTVETLVAVDAIGARARAGDLGPRDRAAVYGFDLVFGAAAIVAGFSAYGEETMLLAVPWSLDGDCPPDAVARYGTRAQGAPLRVWWSPLAQRSPKVRAIVSRWAEALPATGGPDEVPLGPSAPLTWPATDYVSPRESNQVPVALDTPTTRLSGVARRVGGRWRLELAVDLWVAYPERSSMGFGPFTLEEGMFHDTEDLLRPYCARWRWTVDADDPALRATGPDRGPFEAASTAILRAIGAGRR